jgi:hypothetical protein
MIPPPAQRAMAERAGCTVSQAATRSRYPASRHGHSRKRYNDKLHT